MLMLFLILFTCHTHAMNDDTPTQDLQEWIETLRPAPIDQNRTIDTHSASSTTLAHSHKRSIQSISSKSSAEKKEYLKKLSLQQVRCPLYIKGCPWVCVHTKPAATITQRIIQADCAYQLREHCIQEHFSLEIIMDFVESEMEKEVKINLDNCDTDNVYVLATATLTDTNE